VAQSACASLKIFGTPLADGPRLRKIDEQSRPDHARLSADDECCFLYEYTSGKNYSFSSTNSLISNLKKKPGATGYQHKLQAVGQCARAFAAINPQWLDGATLIPVPPSKAKGDPGYDDRMSQVCRRIRGTPALDVRELVVQRSSLPAAHESQQRPSVDDLVRAYEINELLSNPRPRRIGVFDDVLTAGTHFVAMKRVLSARFAGVSISGFFIARRVFPDPFTETP
jgi:predicted amidophosphoribosyltransferase